MIIQSADIFRFRSPLERAVSPGTSPPYRSGLLLKLTSPGGKMGWGETSPLPGASAETIDEAESQLFQILPHLLHREFEPHDIVDGIQPSLLPEKAPLLPSVATGIDMAVRDLCNTANHFSIPVNVLLGSDPTLDEIHAVLDKGYQCIKFKVGRQHPEKEQKQVLMIQGAIQGHATLRLDANKAWTLEEAVKFFSGLELNTLEYIEEPVRHVSDLSHFLQKTNIPVALDQSLLNMDPQSALLPSGVRALIVKPTLLGGYLKSQQWINVAKKTHRQWTLTHCFESPVGIMRLAMWIHHWHGFQQPMGLDVTIWGQIPWLKTLPRIYNGCLTFDAHSIPIKEKRLEWIEHV